MLLVSIVASLSRAWGCLEWGGESGINFFPSHSSMCADCPLQHLQRPSKPNLTWCLLTWPKCLVLPPIVQAAVAPACFFFCSSVSSKQPLVLHVQLTPRALFSSACQSICPSRHSGACMSLATKPLLVSGGVGCQQRCVLCGLCQLQWQESLWSQVWHQHSVPWRQRRP